MLDPAIPAQSAFASLAEIRQHFPALARSLRGNPVAYFDGPGGTQVPRAVVEAMSDYLLNHNANTHWAFPTSEETDAIVAGARETLADFLCANPEEIVFGANMTSLTFHLARALGRGFAPGDEIVVTELDHHANVAPWRALAQERELTIRVARMIPETGQLDWDHFAEQLNDRTKLVALGAASNALGTVNDVRRAAEMAHRVGARIFVDAVAYAPHALMDVHAFDCDFLSCSSYKFYGPHLGILYGREDLLSTIDFPRLEPAPNESPERVETGTQNFEGMAGAAAAVDFLASLGRGERRRERLHAAFEDLHAREKNLAAQLWNGLAEIDRVRLYGPPPDQARTPTVAFTVQGLTSEVASRSLAARGIFASSGDFYATTAVARLGLTNGGLVRAGCACYTSEEEIGRLVEETRALAAAA
ncbi:MAG: cysteine desulfurase-like protein [Chthoniobacterales bacterium]